jgi:hypothetical protein
MHAFVDLDFLRNIVFVVTAKSLNLSAAVYHNLLSYFIANCHHEIQGWVQIQILNKLGGKVFRLIVRIANVPA